MSKIFNYTFSMLEGLITHPTKNLMQKLKKLNQVSLQEDIFKKLFSLDRTEVEINGGVFCQTHNIENGV